MLIADFENGTNDPTFDRTLEPMLKRALEGASFISAFDRSGISGTLGVRPPETLDETSAREIAVKQGLGRCALRIHRAAKAAACAFRSKRLRR